MRKFGYSLRISAIAAMSTAGLLTYELVDGSVDGHKFLKFIQGKLIPDMRYMMEKVTVLYSLWIIVPFIMCNLSFKL
jgi:hypothetical protein